MCKYFYDDTCKFTQCMVGETVINCTCVPNTSFNKVWEAIIGDLTNING